MGCVVRGATRESRTKPGIMDRRHNLGGMLSRIFSHRRVRGGDQRDATRAKADSGGSPVSGGQSFCPVQKSKRDKAFAAARLFHRGARGGSWNTSPDTGPPKDPLQFPYGEGYLSQVSRYLHASATIIGLFKFMRSETRRVDRRPSVRRLTIYDQFCTYASLNIAIINSRLLSMSCLVCNLNKTSFFGLPRSVSIPTASSLSCHVSLDLLLDAIFKKFIRGKNLTEYDDLFPHFTTIYSASEITEKLVSIVDSIRLQRSKISMVFSDLLLTQSSLSWLFMPSPILLQRHPALQDQTDPHSDINAIRNLRSGSHFFIGYRRPASLTIRAATDRPRSPRSVLSST